MKLMPRNLYTVTQRGLTLVEMMVALLISVVLMAGVIQIFASSKKSHKLTDSMGFMQESGRMALSTVVNDVRRAGHWGGNKALARMTGGTASPTTPISTNYGDCPTTTDAWALNFTQRIFGLNDNSTGYNCVNVAGTPYLSGDVIAVRYALAQPTANPAMVATTLYIRSAMDMSRVFYGTNQGDPENTVNGPTTVSYPVAAVAYYVGTSSETCNGASIPALFQVTIGANGLPSAREIIPGIEDLQVRYGVDTDAVADGIANQYMDASTLNTAANFGYWNHNGIDETNKVVSARIWLVARAACTDPSYDQSASYNYADQSYTKADNYRRQLYTATVSLRN